MVFTIYFVIVNCINNQGPQCFLRTSFLCTSTNIMKEFNACASAAFFVYVWKSRNITKRTMQAVLFDGTLFGNKKSEVPL